MSSMLIEYVNGTETGRKFLKGTNGALHVADGALTTLIDSTTTAGYTYIGEAVPGTATSAASWRVARITDATGSMYYAGGQFDQIWDNRASLTYA